MTAIDSVSVNAQSFYDVMGTSVTTSKTSATTNAIVANNNSSTNIGFPDFDKKGIVSINDLNTKLMDLVTQQKENDASGKVDEQLDNKIKATKQMINDFQNWSKQQHATSSSDSSYVNDEFMQSIVKGFGAQTGILANLSA